MNLTPAPGASSAPGAEITLSARDLSRRFGTHHAVRGIDLELRRGEVLGLLGPNGAGKTTTLQMLTGNLAPSSGSVSICGIDLLERPTRAKAHLGYLPEVPPLYRELSVTEYLRLAGRLHGLRGAALSEAVRHTQRRCAVESVAGQVIGTLSKGYQQRVGIAQAVVHNPDVVILDEPTVGLDPNQIREIRALIRELSSSHSVILSTHILPEVEAVCDRVQILNQGSIVFSDTIAALAGFRQALSLRVGLRAGPAVGALESLPGVVSVQALEPGQFRLLHRDGEDPTDALVGASVREGWGLTHLSREGTTLEDVFVQLTQREGEPAE